MVSENLEFQVDYVIPEVENLSRVDQYLSLAAEEQQFSLSLVNKCCSKNPQLRYKSVSSYLKDSRYEAH